MALTKIKLNEYISLEVEVPEETDIATFDGIGEMIRRIHKVSGGIISTQPQEKRGDAGRKTRWTKETARQFIENSYNMSDDEVIEKYNIKTIDKRGYIQKTRTYLRMKHNIKDERRGTSGPPKAETQPKETTDNFDDYHIWTDDEIKKLKIMKDNQDYSCEDIASSLNLEEQQVKSKINNLKQKGQWDNIDTG